MADPQLVSKNGPAEILRQGLAAAAAGRADLARQFFAQLQTDFPGTPEAARAHSELSSLATLVSKTQSDPAADDDGEESQQERLDVIRREFLTGVGDRVFFAENSATIGGRARSVIEAQARWLKIRPSLTLTLIGRADDGGSPQDAKDLSTQRAQAVSDRLIAAGLEPSRIQLEARGDKDPVAICKSSLCQAQNRNVESLVLEDRPSLGLSPAADGGRDIKGLGTKDAAARVGGDAAVAQ